jgi:hypothetical protein
MRNVERSVFRFSGSIATEPPVVTATPVGVQSDPTGLPRWATPPCPLLFFSSLPVVVVTELSPQIKRDTQPGRVLPLCVSRCLRGQLDSGRSPQNSNESHPAFKACHVCIYGRAGKGNPFTALSKSA